MSNITFTESITPLVRIWLLFVCGLAGFMFGFMSGIMLMVLVS